jgi:hypothetical protein
MFNFTSPFQYVSNLIGRKTAIKLPSNPVEKISKAIDSSVKEGTKKVGKIIEDSGKLIPSPTKWLKDMQRSWLIYVISMTIICLCILFLYCAWQGYCSRRRRTADKRLADQLAQITMIMTKNNSANVSKY